MEQNDMAPDPRWPRAVRALALLAALLAVVVALEARALRHARAELQQLRDERARVTAGVTSGWAKLPADEFREALRWLDAFAAEPLEGLGRPGGLCPGGTLDAAAIADYVAGAFLPTRAAGRSMETSIEAMKTAVQQSAAYRAAHPGNRPR